MIHNPGEVVFDEVHFGKFASFYLRGEYYFDVHPPLAKLLLAGVGWLVGYDGHFLFETIGQDYAENNVPYIAFRIWCAFCGAAVIPVSFLIMKELGASVIACTLGALLLAFDNALVAQSRLILLDSMLWLTGILAIYFWIKFRKLRHEPFTFSWWFWLSMSGFGLALVTQVKMVGLFLVASVGIATVIDLWELSDLKRGLSLQQVWRHFSARAMCLIVLPFLLYLIPFYIHFKLLPASGTGDAFMSLRFQETLNGNRQTLGASYIPYSSNITLKNVDSNVYLHSHSHRIPLKHKDGRISSNGQQVNAY
jgi:dolichyl-phosphate-mannose-protein mannosyltransferase